MFTKPSQSVSDIQNNVAADPAPIIRKTPGVVGGDARVRNTRIPVWTLVELKKQGRTEQQLLGDSPGSLRMT